MCPLIHSSFNLRFHLMGPCIWSYYTEMWDDVMATRLTGKREWLPTSRAAAAAVHTQVDIKCAKIGTGFLKHFKVLCRYFNSLLGRFRRGQNPSGKIPIFKGLYNVYYVVMSYHHSTCLSTLSLSTLCCTFYTAADSAGVSNIGISNIFGGLCRI